MQYLNINKISSTLGEWSSPWVTGQPPPPCYSFTLTSVGERRAALFGGWSEPLAISNGLMIVELSKNDVVSVQASIVCSNKHAVNEIAIGQLYYCCDILP